MVDIGCGHGGNVHGWWRHKYVHPSQENPALWRAMRYECWHRWGEHCLYRSPAFGILCNRTWKDPVPWSWSHPWPAAFRKTTKMNADHIFPAYLYPDKRWDQNNLQTLCQWHNDKKGIRGHIDYRPGHYCRWKAMTLWWLLVPFYILKWLVKQR